MATNIVWSTLYLGNIADMDSGEGTFEIEDTSEILTTFGSTGDPLFNHVTNVTTNSTDNDDLNSDNTGTSDTLSYDLGGGTIVSQLDSLPLMAGTVTFNDGSTLGLSDLSVFQDTEGNVFLAIRDNQPALAAQGIRSVEFTSVTGSGYSGLFQGARDDLEFVCYATGTLIDTPDGPRAVETLQPGDIVTTLDHGPQMIRWVHSNTQPLEGARRKTLPILIDAGALGEGLPVCDLIVSSQHRILVGGGGQLQKHFTTEALAPAKSLTAMRGIRTMEGSGEITWVHFACDRHEIVFANGCWSESLLLGPMVFKGLTNLERQDLTEIYGMAPSSGAALNGQPARECLKVGYVRHSLASDLRMQGRTEKESRVWDIDLAMERYETERLCNTGSMSQPRLESAA